MRHGVVRKVAFAMIFTIVLGDAGNIPMTVHASEIMEENLEEANEETTSEVINEIDEFLDVPSLKSEAEITEESESLKDEDSIAENMSDSVQETENIPQNNLMEDLDHIVDSENILSESEESESTENLEAMEDFDANKQTIENDSENKNFSNIILFVEFQDVSFGSELEEILTSFDEENPQSLPQYLERISYGQLNLNNIFPQYKNDKIAPCILQGNQKDYYNKEYIIVEEALKLLFIDGTLEENVDLDDDWKVDNLMIIVPGEEKDDLRKCQYVYDGPISLNDSKISNYCIVFERDSIGKIAHKFLHIFGYPDLFAPDGEESRFPVGNWGFMSQEDPSLSYPLSYLRSEVTGWLDIPVIEQNKEGYSLYPVPDSVDEIKGRQAVILKTDYSNDEFFVVECRNSEQINSTNYGLETSEPGLIIYRVNMSSMTNKSEKPWMIYVFRPNDDYGNDDKEEAKGDLAQAYLSEESGRTSYGNDQPEASVSNGAITYADGTNSGIIITNIENIENTEIKFDIVFSADQATGGIDFIEEDEVEEIPEEPEMQAKVGEILAKPEMRVETTKEKPITVYQGIDYSAVYDYAFYVEKYPDVKNAFGKESEAVLCHFVLSGMKEGRQGNADFNVYTYKNRYADLRSIYGNDLPQYYMHYINAGKNEMRNATGSSLLQNPFTIYEGVDYSAVYDYNYYIHKYSDIRKVFGEDDGAVLRHFALSGMKEGRQGNADFNVYTYKNRYADLRRAFKNDLSLYYMHYNSNGIKEKRNARGVSSLQNPLTVYAGVDYSAVYDYFYYVKKYPDIKSAYGEDDEAVLGHFVISGMREGRRGNEAFNVNTYKNRYPDLRAAYGNDLKKYFEHYLKIGKSEKRSGEGTSNLIGSITIYNGIDYSEVYDYNYYVNAYPDIKKAFSDDDTRVLEHFVVSGMAEGRIASANFNVHIYMNNYIDLQIAYGGDWKAYFMHYLNYGRNEGRTGAKRLPLQENDQYFGYYEGYKITSKKGIQGISAAYTEDLRVQHVMLNVDLADMVSIGQKPGYVPYVYKGKTYYFQDLIALKKTVYDLHGWGSTEGNPYGMNHMRAVTLNLLLSWKDDLAYLIHPSARVKGAAPYYALNMKESNARDTFEALFCYMGEGLGEYKRRVSNWTLGNEVNSCNEWNYSGGMSLQENVSNYAQAFQLLYQGVVRTARSSRIFISLDHCWTKADAGFSGKAFLDEFAAYMNQTAPNMRWNVNYHPYSVPLSRSDFWNDFSNTTDDPASTKYVSMRNLDILTNYLSTLETRYGKQNGSIRVIIGELGYSAAGGDSNAEAYQAAALGYGYYKAMFNTRVDAYIIRAYLDDPAETVADLRLGLRRGDAMQTPKRSYDLYKNLDTANTLGYMEEYKKILGISSWESAISGFDGNKLVVREEDF